MFLFRIIFRLFIYFFFLLFIYAHILQQEKWRQVIGTFAFRIQLKQLLLVSVKHGTLVQANARAIDNVNVLNTYTILKILKYNGFLKFRNWNDNNDVELPKYMRNTH